jgi:hypothetical protein
MEGILALMIPIVAITGFFGWLISLSPLGKALAERVKHGAVPRGSAESEELQGELLEGVEQLRREVAELAERVDFTERLLGQQQQRAQIARPR